MNELRNLRRIAVGTTAAVVLILLGGAAWLIDTPDILPSVLRYILIAGCLILAVCMVVWLIRHIV